MKNTSSKNEVNSKLQEIALYHMPMTSINCDNQYVALYQNNTGMVYKTMRLHGNIYPQDLTLHANRFDQLQMYDDWNNAYYHVNGEDLVVYTWQGQPLFNGGM